ncbi:RNase adapter RapZ [Mechercharimyces sp. CAU 1602]|uniref:RNase adapter RapZ n=1 Tax=Mechercharimyces sp. CAU 1602 TaxID=2973933 RepID=UPI0021629DE9|nr:RNase adapter RapZ [Mechercharimyces sp. CAU 1602]MCS1352201.1 RNase adapter RapZ [Mechercharimyces sp. CAU 1602]
MDNGRDIHLVVITGMSGAGKTVAVQSLEDIGFFCIDNLPSVLLPKFVDLIEQSGGQLRRAALVIDMRGRDFFSSLLETLDTLGGHEGIKYHILFLDADDASLVARYKETRRLHPLSPDGTPLEGINRERKLLDEIKGRADSVIDTSRLKPVALKEKLVKQFSQEPSQLSVTFLSFGFKHGLPLDVDLVFDVRFLPNPHYVHSLRPHTGQDEEVYEYVMKWPETQQFIAKLEDLLSFLLPHYLREGKSQLVVGIGCTGGQHRSVAIAEYLYRHFNEKQRCQVSHRDAKKGQQ